MALNFEDVATANLEKEMYEALVAADTDKVNYHSYEIIYGKLFEYPEEVSDILEVGIHLGASLRGWTNFFKNANVIGLDNNRDRFITEDRITSMYVDQMDRNSFDLLKELLGDKRFQFIVDDGCHEVNATISTFYDLIPLLKLDGWYIVEDIRKVDVPRWEEVQSSLSDNYKSFLIDLNHVSKTNYEDNIVFAVKRTA